MAARIRSIASIHGSLDPVFERMGICVHRFDPPEGVVSLPELLRGLPSPPDCVIHQEHLGKRVILTDQHALPCPTLFWALDPHLNRYWQRHYARLFSATATTQRHLCPDLADAAGRPAAWVTWHGQPRPFVPHAGRTAALGFAGRITRGRRRRSWFVEHLGNFGLTSVDDRFGEALAAFYDTVRIAPNECIAGDINMRLFEAASSGCLPLAEKTPPGVAELFIPDREALYYEDVLELDDRLRFALTHPERTEAMARAAHTAIAERHLPEHRAAALLDAAARAETAPDGETAATSLALALYHLRRAGRLALPVATVLRHLEAATPWPEVIVARLQLAQAAGDRETVLALASRCLADPGLVADSRVAMACCLAACRVEAPEVAKRAYVAFAASRGRKQVARLDGAYDYLLFFAGVLDADGYTAEPGMPFEPAVHLPATATQCLIAAGDLRPEESEPNRRLETVLRRSPGTEAERVGLLSDLTLHAPDDWSMGLRLALTDLGAFRREAGLEETILAGRRAVAQGTGERFFRRLAQFDPSGRLRRELAAFAAWQEIYGR